MSNLLNHPSSRRNLSFVTALALLVLGGCARRDGGPGGDDPSSDGGGGMVEDMAQPGPTEDVLGNNAPPDAKDQFGGPPGTAPTFVYPLEGAYLARNIAQMQLAWRAAPGQKVFRIVAESATYKRTFYLGPAGCMQDRCSYNVRDQDWSALAKSASGQAMTLTLSGTSGAGGPVGTAAPMTLRFSPEDVKGGLYYFATVSQGLFRVPFGATRAQPFLGGGMGACVGCHAISPDGKKVAATWDRADGQGVMVEGVDANKFLVRPETGEQWNFATFNPDGSKLLTVWAGEMKLRDGQSGAVIKTVPKNLLGGGATMPEWSADGKSIVFVRVASPDGRLGKDMGALAGDWIIGDAGDIAVLPYNDGNFGASVTIVPRIQGQEYHFYPSMSPDSQWIVFNSARRDQCDSPTAANNSVTIPSGVCVSYDQTAARLRLVRAQAGATPIELRAATQKANMATTWPKFAPFQQSGGKLMFITYSSKFDYGWVVNQAQVKINTGLEQPQLWMSAIDLNKVDGDPSYPPFWLPFQDSTTNNHEAIWTKDIACVRNADCGDEFECVGGVCVLKLG